MKKESKQKVKVPLDSRMDLEQAEKLQIKFLRLLFEHDELATMDIAKALDIPKGLADYFRDILAAAGMIVETSPGLGMDWPSNLRSPKYGLSQKGRKHVVEIVGWRQK